MKMERTVSSETSVIRTQTPGNYPKRNKLHLEHGESLKTRKYTVAYCRKRAKESAQDYGTASQLNESHADMTIIRFTLAKCFFK